MSTITRERVANLLQFNSEGSDCQSNAEQWEVHELARIALASLEADAVAYVDPFAFHNFSVYRAGETDNKRMGREWMWANPDAGLIPVYTAPPAPVSVPAAMEMDDDFDSSFEHGKAVGWNACRAAMLQAGTLTNEGTIPVTQFKPVADLYGLTSPTGGETSFTFDAVEARDFIDGGWSCQDYVELERFQEAVSGNSPVIPDGWVMVPLEPTEDMIVNGFESEPDESFSDEKEWEEYDAMSGCQQAAHRAKLCYSAMIKAAPKLE
ncbi:hypothetical protein M7981_23155 [Enterobacter hormaechei subsp. xiangfangensis]|uniref:hypothetical protein n=1 Tax=Enterobacter hormaechei TaxID=158836 RepID=UPI002238516D|nr:hypothetical protein [Enterobacter hormaechei]MCW5013374.1 hypothetical protein [Enterobacter hormaechei subsp. xiangfangensis]